MPARNKLARSDVDAEQRADADQRRRARLTAKLHDQHDAVGQAYSRMCKAGCERVWLQTALLSLARYPLHPTRIKAFPIEEKRRMERVIRKLESARVDLERFDHSVFISGWPPQSPVELEHLFAQVEDLEFGLRHVAKTANPRVMTARDRVPYLLQVIKKATGRAHYPEMATLIGAAYNEPSFDAENLKMLDHRNGQSRRQK